MSYVSVVLLNSYVLNSTNDSRMRPGHPSHSSPGTGGPRMSDHNTPLILFLPIRTTPDVSSSCPVCPSPQSLDPDRPTSPNRTTSPHTSCCTCLRDVVLPRTGKPGTFLCHSLTRHGPLRPSTHSRRRSLRPRTSDFPLLSHPTCQSWIPRGPLLPPRGLYVGRVHLSVLGRGTGLDGVLEPTQ